MVLFLRAVRTSGRSLKRNVILDGTTTKDCERSLANAQLLLLIFPTVLEEDFCPRVNVHVCVEADAVFAVDQHDLGRTVGHRTLVAGRVLSNVGVQTCYEGVAREHVGYMYRVETEKRTLANLERLPWRKESTQPSSFTPNMKFECALL